MHGGKRDGAGRKRGSNWKADAKVLRPKISALRAETVDKMAAIVGGENDPLSVVAAMVLDPSLDVMTRLSAANCCLPFLYPKLSASQVDARVTNVKVDSADLLRRLDEQIEKLAQGTTLDATPEPAPMAIEVQPEEDD